MEKPAWPSNTAAKEKPARPSDRMMTSSSISERGPCCLVDPHRIRATSETAASEAAMVAAQRTPTLEKGIWPPPDPSGSSRGALSSAIPSGIELNTYGYGFSSERLDKGGDVCLTESENRGPQTQSQRSSHLYCFLSPHLDALQLIRRLGEL